MIARLRAAAIAAALGLAVVGLGVLAGGPPILGLPAVAVLAALAMTMQWVAWLPASALRTERFYDLTGSLTYVSLTATAVALTAPHGLTVRQLAVAACVTVWAVRLGTYLARRIRADGTDGRFDGIREDPDRFLFAWSLQGVWVTLTALAAWIVLTTPTQPALGVTDALGLAMWAAGFTLEVVADTQKARFRARPGTRGTWIDEGVWSWSRHPNYLGEIVLWTGIAVMASPVMRGTAWVGLISPVFVYALLRWGSGVPPLERRADARWGDDPDYQAYKARVPVLVPRPW